MGYGRNLEKGEAPVHNVFGAKRIMSSHEQQQFVNDIIEWIMNGHPKRYIIEFYSNTKGLTSSYVEKKYQLALDEIKQRSTVDMEIIFNVHINMYEEIYQFFEETNNVVGKRKTLFAKEKLMGLHKEETNLQVNNITNFEMQEAPIYNLNKLSEEQKTKLNQLLEKINKND